MKTKCILCFLVLALAQNVWSQVSTNFLFRYRFPVLNDTIRCDLSPLFAWWTQQSILQSTLRGTNNTSEIVTTDTPNPMPQWTHIVGQLSQVTPQGWIVDGTLETAPGQRTSARILLIHPPRSEMARFAQHTALLNSPLPKPDYSAQQARIDNIYNRAFIANTFGDPDWEDYYASEAAREESDLNAQKQRDQDLEKQRADNLASLGDFPADWQTYQIDLFALNTGRAMQGLPVFDAGLSFVK